jgi:adenosylmethionine-8-amino-7-oxononanoate aminotransferase
MDTAALAALDRAHLWHPFTQQREWVAEPPLMISHAEGCTLYDTDGRGYLDGVSSLWCNVHGHRHPVLDAAVRAQLDRVAHSTLLGLSHPGAAQLAAKLVEIAPPGLRRVFYSDNGSSAAEVAVKMAYQYWQHRGEPQRTGFVCLRDAYHGDTLGAVSVGGIELFHSIFRPLLFDAWHAEPGDAEQMRSLLAEHGERVAAVIVEPLVQGAAGMLVHPPGYLRAIRELCDAHGVLLICDEVATGFGRTGTMFACEQERVAPDLLCLAKGLTGGYLPLAATLTTEAVYDAFLGAHAEFKTFFHGHTYTANPLACAAALATLEVFESERTLERLAPKLELLGALLAEHVAPLPAVAEIRRRGLMTGIALSGFPVAARAGHRVTLAARRRGAIIRPLGDVVVLMPPLAISEAELRRLVEIVAAAISEVGSALQRREVDLARAADGAEPVAGDVLEGGAGRDAAVGVAGGGVVDEPARLADPLLNGLGRHGG